jgi:hypothetical protein
MGAKIIREKTHTEYNRAYDMASLMLGILLCGELVTLWAMGYVPTVTQTFAELPWKIHLGSSIVVFLSLLFLYSSLRRRHAPFPNHLHAALVTTWSASFALIRIVYFPNGTLTDNEVFITISILANYAVAPSLRMPPKQFFSYASVACFAHLLGAFLAGDRPTLIGFILFAALLGMAVRWNSWNTRYVFDKVHKSLKELDAAELEAKKQEEKYSRYYSDLKSITDTLCVSTWANNLNILEERIEERLPVAQTPHLNADRHWKKAQHYLSAAKESLKKIESVQKEFHHILEKVSKECELWNHSVTPVNISYGKKLAKDYVRSLNYGSTRVLASLILFGCFLFVSLDIFAGRILLPRMIPFTSGRISTAVLSLAILLRCRALEKKNEVVSSWIPVSLVLSWLFTEMTSRSLNFYYWNMPTRAEGFLTGVLFCLGFPLFPILQRAPFMTLAASLFIPPLIVEFFLGANAYTLIAIAASWGIGLKIYKLLDTDRLSCLTLLADMEDKLQKHADTQKDLNTKRELCIATATIADKLNSPLLVLLNTVQFYKTLRGNGENVAEKGVDIDATLGNDLMQLVVVSQNLATLREEHSQESGASPKSLFETTKLLLLSNGERT